MSHPEAEHAPHPPLPPGPSVVEIPRIPEHSRLYRFLHHPFVYVLLFALWFACNEWKLLPSQERPAAESTTVARDERDRPAYTLTDIFRQLFPEPPSGSKKRRLAAALLSGIPLLLGTALFFTYLILRSLHVRLFPRVGFHAAWWDTWHLVRVAIVFLVIARVVNANLAAVQYVRTPGTVWYRIPLPVLKPLSTSVMFLATCAFVFLLMGVGGGHPLRALGLWERQPFRRAAAGVLAFLAALPLIVLAAVIMRVVWVHMGKEVRLQDLLEKARHMPSTAFFIVGFAGVVIASITEEILFRGFLYAILRRYAGAFGSIVASALVFAFLHEPIAFLPIFVIGCLLAYLYERTGSLIAPIAAHASNNLYAFLFIYVHYR